MINLLRYAIYIILIINLPIITSDLIILKFAHSLIYDDGLEKISEEIENFKLEILHGMAEGYHLSLINKYYYLESECEFTDVQLRKRRKYLLDGAVFSETVI
jgi:hypothetical protein